MKRSEIKQRMKRDSRRSSTWDYFHETRYPSSKQADELHKRRLPLDIDPEIRPTVLKLNREGFRTQGSCAGHKDRGFIVLSKLKPERKEDVRVILKDSGLKSIRVEKYGNNGYIAKYNPIGVNSKNYKPSEAKAVRAKIKRLRDKAQKGMR
jgi:hypothetical protein